MGSVFDRAALLEFYRDCGVDAVLGTAPGALARKPLEPLLDPVAEKKPFVRQPDRASESVVTAASTPSVVGAIHALEEAEQIARRVTSLPELIDAIKDFDGFAIKRTATKMVFADGVSGAPIMIVGEAPGADEDRIGRPFVGAAGQLLDKMFAAIGRSREAQGEDVNDKGLYITNVLNWRPPGNRTPTPPEIDLARPFLEKHIALVNPRYLVAAGSVALKALLRIETGITKIHGVFQEFVPAYPDFFPQGGATRIPCLPLFHPSYLLRSPDKKRDAWTALQLLQNTITPS